MPCGATTAWSSSEVALERQFTPSGGVTLAHQGNERLVGQAQRQERRRGQEQRHKRQIGRAVLEALHELDVRALDAQRDERRHARDERKQHGEGLASAPAWAEADAEALGAPVAAARADVRPSMMLGLTQWTVLGGGNIAAQVKFSHFAVEYSHGQALAFDRVPALGLTEAEREAGVAVGMPWTTGGGFGVQITRNLHVLLEAKLHRYEIEDDVGGSIGYTSFTLGPGVFYDLYLWKGLFVQPNLRWWPTLGSTYEGPQTLRTDDGSEYRHERHDLSLPFVNVNLGWTFTE